MFEPDKKRDTYDTFFGLLKTALTSQNLELSARTVMSDFEVCINYKLYPIPCHSLKLIIIYFIIFS